MTWLRKSLALVILLATFATHTFAQNSAPSESFTDEEKTALAKAVAELEGRRVQVADLQSALKLRDESIATLRGIITEQAAIVVEWKTAATERRTANEADARIAASYAESVKRFEEEVARLRKERDSYRKQRNILLIVLVAIIGGGGVVAASNN